MKNSSNSKQLLSELFQAALDAVEGSYVVDNVLQRIAIKGNVAVVAIGKAASAMMLGAQNQLNKQIQSALVITKIGHVGNMLNCKCIEAGHPIPNEDSLNAGVNLLEFIEKIPSDTRFLALISGGASALVEVLPENIDLQNLQKANKWLVSSGLAINEMNQIRKSISLIKGGKALNYLCQKRMTQLLISDVKNNLPAIIGSGLFVSEKNITPIDMSKLPDWLKKMIQTKCPPTSDILVESYIVASNEMACEAVITKVKSLGLDVIYHGQTLYGNVYEKADSLALDLITGESGIHIWGGETTIVLPEKTGKGGRNQSLALALACKLENISGITVLLSATDGSDGETEDVGAIIDGLTLQRGGKQAKDYLLSADAGTFLAEAGDLISTGPTGTNVMDIVIALKEKV